MSFKRTDRISEEVKKELSNVIRELKDPRIPMMTSVVTVNVTNDLSYAKAYISAMEGIDAAKEAAAGLKNAAGYIRREIGQRLRLRKTPELRFVADDSIEHGMSIAKMLNDLNK